MENSNVAEVVNFGQTSPVESDTPQTATTLEENAMSSQYLAEAVDTKQNSPLETITPQNTPDLKVQSLSDAHIIDEISKLKADLKLHDEKYALQKLNDLVRDKRKDPNMGYIDRIRFSWYMKLGTAANVFMDKTKMSKKDSMRELCNRIGRKNTAIKAYMAIAKYSDSLDFLNLGLERLQSLAYHISNLSKLHGKRIHELAVGLNMLKQENDEPLLEFAEKIARMPAGEFNKKALILLLDKSGRTKESKSWDENQDDIKLSQAKSILLGKTDNGKTEKNKRKGRTIAPESIDKAFKNLGEKLGKYLQEGSLDSKKIVQVRNLLTDLYNNYVPESNTQQNGEEQKTE